MVGWARLESQWVDMKKHGDPIWGDVHCSGFDREPWLPVLKKIEGAAAALGLTMAGKEHDTIDSSRFVYQNRVRQFSSQLSQQSQDTFSQNEVQEGLIDHTALSNPSEESLSATDAPLCTAGGKLCFFCWSEEEEVPRLGVGEETTPRLLYRWWNVNSQGVNRRDLFIAGLFMDPCTPVYPSNSIPDNEFRQRFLDHITPTPDPSPFISTFRSALAPVHRALRGQEGATVSIIDRTKLKPDSKIFSAKEFVKKNFVRIPGSRYDGRGEYLIWGSIQNDAIICSFKITTLCGIAANDPDIKRFLQLESITASENAGKRLHREMKKSAMDLNQRTGAAVGRLLSSLGVPCEYYKAVSEGLAHSWRLKSRHKPWDNFNKGVSLGFRGEYTLPSPSPSPITNSEDPLISFEIISDSPSPSDDDEFDAFTNDEDKVVLSPRNINANPTAGDSPDTARMFPIINLEDRSVTPFPRFSSIGLDNDVEEELGIDGFMDDQDFDFSGELGQSQQISTDQFANDRARVRSALEKLPARR
ncbi:hypothetical protein BJX68DRAFT_266830 [Aspergillus pseudodeflectus]|uniref:DUF7587 domain-containing protein n=1 Tax=Aspergillus pseudodeflectus TaxID=176178 RepID=A0ABR4KCM5_9EURO